MAISRSIDKLIDLNDEASRVDLTHLIMRLFERWSLDTVAQLNLLGLSPNSRAMLSRYRRGAALPATRDLLDRVGWLLAIHKALRLLYPQNESLRYTWVHRRHDAFNHSTPLETMMEGGIIGIATVARYLDWQRGR